MMKRFDADLPSDQLKEKILDAADKRFKAQGFKKTAMAEIARDLGMSTANLYRYFPSKLDIAEGFALRCFVAKEVILQGVVADKTIPNGEWLHAFASALLRYNYDELQKHPAINDIVVALCAERPALVERKNSGELELLTLILEQGKADNNWQLEDVQLTAKAVLASWTMFITPVFMQHQTLGGLEELLDSILNITINGLKPRT